MSDHRAVWSRRTGPILFRVAVAMLLAPLACAGESSIDVDPTGGPAAAERIASRGESTPFSGYTLFHPLKSTSVYLVDMSGELAHQWDTEYNTGQSVYMLDNGHLLRAARDPEPAGRFRGGGEGGIIQEIAWDGTVVWEYEFSDELKRHHHDIEPMPNGNVLLVAWESRTYEEAVAAGINPARMRDDDIWPDFVVEIEPVYPDGANIVWEWHAWDHMVQELYRDKPNYGVVAEHPELIDINAAPSHRARQESSTPEAVDELRALGYIAGNAATDDRPEIRADWMHTNSIDYNAELDQILLSSRHFSEIWIIDHSTTTEEAAGHTGGSWGRGGDLLYRWGNPEAWGAGDRNNRRLFVQHDARWIEPGLPGAGNILVFNNGTGRPDLVYSSVLEISPPRDADGHYVMHPAMPTGPAEPVWEYVAPQPQNLYSSLLSGAHRLPNGNTLVAAGINGWILEIGADNQVVWEYTNPFVEDNDRQSTERIARAFGAEPPDPHPDSVTHTGDGPSQAGVGAGGGRGRRGGPRAGSIYRATRIPPDHPGLAPLRGASSSR